MPKVHVWLLVAICTTFRLSNVNLDLDRKGAINAVLFPLRKRLFAGTVPANKNLFAGTVPANKNLFAGTCSGKLELICRNLSSRLTLYFDPKNGFFDLKK